jgi:hypothetical protein
LGTSSLDPASTLPARVDRQERSALLYLEQEILPEVKRQNHGDVVKGIESAVAEGSLEPLGELPVAQKHQILDVLEDKVNERAGRPDPTVVVKLTTSLDLTPQALLEAERRRPVLPPR